MKKIDDELKVFTEIGYGNGSFFSTEIEKGEREHRLKKFILPKSINSFYFRIWLGKNNYVCSSLKPFFFIKPKGRVEFKILFGIFGNGVRGR